MTGLDVITAVMGMQRRPRMDTTRLLIVTTRLLTYRPPLGTMTPMGTIDGPTLPRPGSNLLGRRASLGYWLW